MFKAVVCLLVILCASDKPESPREKREAAIKAIKEKMAPIEKKLKGNIEDLDHAKKAPVMEKGAVTSRLIGNIGDERRQLSHYRTKEAKQKDIDRYEAAIEELTKQLKPLQAELKELQKPPKLEKK